MNRSTLSLAGALLLGALACAPAARADGDVSCNEPRDTWRPQMDLQRELKAQGWRVRRVLTTNGCYEVYGIAANRQRVEAYFNPRTFQRVATRYGNTVTFEAQ
jgi:hypothetical protein